MTWRTRSKSITEYLTALIEKDMDQHHDWRETVANKLRTITRETVANKLRTLARDCSMTGTPDILTATLALYEAFDCDNMSVCQAFQTIADYVDNDCDYINRD